MKHAPPPEKPASNARHGVDVFPIVGIGASAGGLEALEQFFSHVPANSGMAFIVVQHLDPTHKGMMPELLQRITVMPVTQVRDRMKVKRDCIYVIPPNKDLSLLHGSLHLIDPIAPRGLRLPIDFFLRSLADDLHERAIAVILSGMGSDGTLGLRAVKEFAGLALVQDPASAKFDGMPRSAIDAGLADIIATPQDLPQRILDFLKRVPPCGTGSPGPEPESAAQKSGLEKIVILLRARTGHDFSSYKKSTIYRRIERRMGIHQLTRITDYVRYLRENPQEVDLLFKELLIGVTSFFRDPDAWAALQNVALPQLLAANPAGRTLRAWVAGCSTGEEAYSLAIAFREVLERVNPAGRFSLQVFATDLDPTAVETARAGRYPANITADLSPERLSRFFVEDEGAYRVSTEIREMVVFAPQNVIMDPPFTKLDILCCRNLLIYLSADLQKKLLPLFHYSLNPGGVLFLGSAETIGNFTNLFAPLEAKSRLYRRGEHPTRAPQVDFPSRLYLSPPAMPDEAKEAPVPNIQTLTEQLLLERVAPAAVLVNAAGDILYISGRTGKYLEPPSGKANWNIHAMTRDGLRSELLIALPKALRDGSTVTHRGINVALNGSTRTVDLSVLAIDEPEALRGMALIVFTDVATPPVEAGSSVQRTPSRGRMAELEQALQRAREEIQSVREEMQSQQEELKSANEELQSTNEELQSTNEELTTSKEEMQSLNEELQTVNAELQSKVDELSAANSDMKNLLNSTEIATIFLDSQLHVRRFTNQATRIFKLIAGDIGRPLTDIVTQLHYPQLQDDAREVLRSLVFSEKQITTGDGRWIMVKIMPYRTLDNVIDGVVITFSDITASKRLEAELRSQKTQI